jgi:hypothetical protein
MVALPSVPGIIRADLKYSYGTNTDLLNRFFYSFTGTATAAALTTFCTTLATLWAANMAPLLVNSLHLQEVTATDLTTPTSHVGTDSPGTPGSISGVGLSASDSMLIKFIIARHYRGGKPRVYIPGQQAGVQTNAEQWTGSATAAMLLAWTNIMAGLSGVSAMLPLVGVGQKSVSYFSGFTNELMPSGRYRVKATPRLVPIVDDVIGWSVNPNVCSQRRRNQAP